MPAWAPTPNENDNGQYQQSLGIIATIDLAALPEAQRQELFQQHATGVLDIGRKARELSVDVGAPVKAAGIVVN
jgi:hypothetical protein